MRIARPVILNHIVSPYGISVLSTLVFLIGWFFPPGLYSQLIREPDLMFLDVQTLLFFLLCVAGFWAGLLLIDFLFPSPPLLENRYRISPLNGVALMLPLTLTTLLTCAVAIKLLRQTPNLLVLLLSQQGGLVKNQMTDVKVGLLGWGSDLQTPLLFWTYWQLLARKPKDDGRRNFGRTLCWTIFVVGLFAGVGLSVLNVSRAALMPLLGGLAVVYLTNKVRRKEVTTAGLFRYLLILGVSVTLLFVLFAMLRGSSDVSVGLRAFVGYTLASYNRLTALLRGTMHYPYGGRGAYLFPFLNSNHLMNAIFPFNQTFKWPDFYELWHSEFVAPQLAGLNDYDIWSGAFGYLFADCGWWTPLMLTVYGVIYGWAWRQMKSGGTLGLTLYPWFAFWVLAWFGGNFAFSSDFPFCVAAGFLLIAYEKLLA